MGALLPLPCLLSQHVAESAGLRRFSDNRQALLNIISNPVNSTVPIAAEVLKQKGVYDSKRLFGVTTLDVVSPALCTLATSHIIRTLAGSFAQCPDRSAGC